MSTAPQLAVRRELAGHRPLRTNRIALAKLRVHPRHIRRDMGDLTALSASLLADGQHQLLTVERRGDFFQIIDGHRRFAAAAIGGLRGLRAEIVPAMTDAEALATMLTTGLHTQPLADAERTHAVRALIDDEHMSTQEVAARCGVTPATIRRWHRAAGPDPIATTASVIPRPRPATDTDRPRGKRTTVGVTRLTGLVDRWTERCTGGLSAEHAQTLLAEIQALLVADPR